MPDPRRDLLRFDFVLGPDVPADHVDLRMEVLREALRVDRRWTDVRVTHMASSDPDRCFVLVWLKRTAGDAVEQIQSDVAETVAAILPGAILSYGPGC